jgi:phage shock protein PspC (stress-responsive transcriptional regulator)
MAEEKRLRRSVDDRVIAGVCGGLANYFDIDPVVVRVVFALLLVFAGGGLLAYLVLWIVMPEEAGGS